MKPGDEITIMAFEFSDTPPTPKVILVDKKNNFVEFLGK
jgi:aspartate 1-decarboxylase